MVSFLLSLISLLKVPNKKVMKEYRMPDPGEEDSPGPRPKIAPKLPKPKKPKK